MQSDGGLTPIDQLALNCQLIWYLTTKLNILDSMVVGPSYQDQLVVWLVMD